MAAPTYTADLTVISTAESVTGWAECTATGWTAGTGPVLEPDFFIQGANCIAKYMTSGGVGVGGWMFNFGSDITIPTDGAFFMWMMAQCPNNYDTFANGGQRFINGNDLANFYGWIIEGKDTNPYGGWKCYPINPTVTVDFTVGTPTSKQYVGGAVKQLANAKGGGGIDVMRYGRGEMKVELGDAADPATFDGMANYNDNISNRFGLFQAIDSGYLYQGLMLLGSASNAVYFIESNANILIPVCRKVTANFNTIEIRNASSRVDWTNVVVSSLSSVSRGRFIVTDNADVNFDLVQFLNMGTFSLLPATTMLNSTFRNCDQITAGGATIMDSLITGYIGATDTAALVWNVNTDTSGKLDRTTFEKGSGTVHAIELGPNCPSIIALVGVKFSNYGAAESSSAAVYNNSGKAITINITSGGDTPTIKNGTGASTTVNNNVLLTLTGLVIGSEIRVYKTSDQSAIDGIESVGATSWSFSVASGVNFYIHIIKTDYEFLRLENQSYTADSSIPIQQRIDRQYSNP